MIPRPGSVMTRDDEAAPTPNCQMMGSPLYVCTNQPAPWGNDPFLPTGARQAAASVSGRRKTPFRSARSNFA